jgi:hypothetical protein
MKHHRIIVCAIAFVVVVLVPINNGQCRHNEGAKTIYGFKLGIFGSGTLNHKAPYSIAKGYEMSTERGISLGGFWDHSFLHDFDLGASIDLHQIRLEGDKEFLLDLGLTLKANIDLNENTLVFRPGAALSFGYLRKIARLDNSNYISLKPFAEMIYFVNDELGLLIELGGHWLMSGGDVWSDVTGGPMLVLRAGIAH